MSQCIKQWWQSSWTMLLKILHDAGSQVRQEQGIWINHIGLAWVPSYCSLPIMTNHGQSMQQCNALKVQVAVEMKISGRYHVSLAELTIIHRKPVVTMVVPHRQALFTIATIQYQGSPSMIRDHRPTSNTSAEHSLPTCSASFTILLVHHRVLPQKFMDSPCSTAVGSTSPGSPPWGNPHGKPPGLPPWRPEVPRLSFRIMGDSVA